MKGLAALPVEVLASVETNLLPHEAAQLQRVSKRFRRAAAPLDELSHDVVNQLLKVLGADGQNGPAALAACAAKRWLARNAASVKRIRCQTDASASACVSLVSRLQALESVDLLLRYLLVPNDLGCLLEALASCPSLKALALRVATPYGQGGPEASWASAGMPALANLRSLTKLNLGFRIPVPYTLTDVVGGLVHLTGLAELRLCLPAVVHGRAVTVPAALGQLKALRSIHFVRLGRCVLEAGCLDLPKLLSLMFDHCAFLEAEVLPGVTALQCLTRLVFLHGHAPPFFDPQLVQLPLQCLIYAPRVWRRDGARVALARLPADLGRLSSTLVHLDCNGCGLTQFPLALMQLAALKCLRATRNEFAQRPAAITALSRLTELMLGRMMINEDPTQLNEQSPLDVCSLRDLSGFPALRNLGFESCEVMLCNSVLGAVQHAGLASLTFCLANPAPECALAVLVLTQALKRLGRGNILSLCCDPEAADIFDWHDQRFAHAVTPFEKF